MGKHDRRSSQKMNRLKAQAKKKDRLRSRRAEGAKTAAPAKKTAKKAAKA